MSSPDVTQSIFSLVHLITHKIKDTLPPPPSPLTSTLSLNRAIRQDIKTIREDPNFSDTGNDDFKHAFAELEAVVEKWGGRGGRTKEERVELALIMEDLLESQGIRRGG